MKIPIFYLIVVILLLMFLTVIGYQFFIINDFEYPVLFSVSALVIIAVMIIAAISTRPNQLDNAEFRNSKVGRELWKQNLKTFVDEHKKDDQ